MNQELSVYISTIQIPKVFNSSGKVEVRKISRREKKEKRREKKKKKD